jgi:hypothetical protein
MTVPAEEALLYNCISSHPSQQDSFQLMQEQQEASEHWVAKLVKIHFALAGIASLGPRGDLG